MLQIPLTYFSLSNPSGLVDRNLRSAKARNVLFSLSLADITPSSLEMELKVEHNRIIAKFPYKERVNEKF